MLRKSKKSLTNGGGRLDPVVMAEAESVAVRVRKNGATRCSPGGSEFSCWASWMRKGANPKKFPVESVGLW